MDHLRYGVILIIVAAFAGGVWTCYLSTSSVQAAAPVESHSHLLIST